MKNISLLAAILALALIAASCTETKPVATRAPAEKELPPEKWTRVKGDFDPDEWKNVQIMRVIDGETFIAAINKRMDTRHGGGKDHFFRIQAFVHHLFESLREEFHLAYFINQYDTGFRKSPS